MIYLLEHSPVIAAHRFFYRPDVKLFIKEFILFSPETGCVSKVTNDGVVDAGLTSVMVLIVRTIKWETVLVPKIYSLYNLPEKKRKKNIDSWYMVGWQQQITNQFDRLSRTSDVKRLTVSGSTHRTMKYLRDNWLSGVNRCLFCLRWLPFWTRRAWRLAKHNLSGLLNSMTWRKKTPVASQVRPLWREESSWQALNYHNTVWPTVIPNQFLSLNPIPCLTDSFSKKEIPIVCPLFVLIPLSCGTLSGISWTQK